MNGKMNGMWRRIRTAVVAAAVAVASVGLSTASKAQFGMFGMESEMGDMLKPAVSTRMLKQYGPILGLSDAQQKASEELLLAYQGDFRDSVDRLKEVYEAIQEETQDTGEWELYQDALPNAMIKFVRRTDKLNRTLMDDLKSLLTPAQLEQFPGFERAMRRKSAFKIGFDGIQKMDLSETVTNLRLDSGAWGNLAPVLGQYEQEMDTVIVAHNKTVREALEGMLESLESGKKMFEDPESMEKMQKMQQDFENNAKKVGEINDKFARQIEGQLPADKKAEFQREIQLTKYPMVYKRSVALRVIEAAEKLDLDAGQKEGLKGIKETYLRDAETANSKWSSVIDEVRASGSEGMGFGGGIWMLRQNEKYQEAQTARKTLDNKTIETVKALLTEEQKKKLPSPSKRPDFDVDQPLGTK
ncbi:MAG: hypothetical protein AB7G11_01105 [Phycisphaerales bacterium]